ncbi:MAG: Holliday junction resolvase RuvX [Acidimicrobiales bacterium]|jgi:putative Holliday junction resolvase
MARILGIDPGTKRCGVAITNAAQTMAFPRPAIPRDDTTLTRIRALIDEEEIGVIVIGRPIALSGHETASTTDADTLFSQVQEHVSVPVTQWDERLTTREAQKSLSEAGLTTKESRDRVDSAAAVVMLQNYVDGLNAE